MIWHTSDTHFGHVNIAGPKTSKWDNGYRNFDSVYEMDKTIIQTINKYVKPDDILYHNGDFAMGGHKYIERCRHALLCQNIHLCIGNHDGHIHKYKHLFTSVDWVQHLSYNKFKFFMSHYSHRVWEGSHKGYIHLYGHSHDTIPDHGKSMDVGIDVAYKMFGEYRPFSIDEIISIMDKKDIVFVDDHGPNTNVK